MCNDWWYMPSPAPVVTAELTPAGFSTIVSPILTTIRNGTNNITMGWVNGGVMDLNFSITAEDGFSVSQLFTFRIVQDGPRTVKNWTAIVSAAGSSVTISDASSTASLPFTAAFATASITFTLSNGVTVLPTSIGPVVLGGRGSTTYSSSFAVYAESGATVGQQQIAIVVGFNTQPSWSLTVNGAVVTPMSLSSSTTTTAVTTAFVGYASATPIALDNSTLTYW
jgi:hypothetical protein